MSNHLDLDLLRQIQAGDRPPSDLAAAALGHLLEICPDCRRAVEAWRAQAAQGPGADGQSPASSEASPRPVSERLPDPLTTRSLAEWAERVRQAPASYASPSLAARLLAAIPDLLPDHISKTRELASLAGVILRHCTASPEVVSSYALSVAYLANAWRAQGDLIQAQSLMDAARFLWEPLQRERLDPLKQAELDGLDGSLKSVQLRCSESAFLLGRAAKTFLAHGSEVEAAKCFIIMAGTFQERSEFHEAEKVLSRASKPLRLRQAPAKHRLLALHCRAYNLYLLDRGREARRLFEALRDLYDEIPDSNIQLRRNWLDGHICELEGRFGDADERFREARDGFLAMDRLYCAASLTRDLAILYAKQGRVREVEALIDEAIPVFEAQEVRSDADAARKILRDALGDRRATN